MKPLRWIQLAATLLLLAGCSSNTGGAPIISIFGPSPTLPPPSVGVTPAPDARAAMTRFLEALKNNDLTGMYAMLSSSAQTAVPQDAFLTKYTEALNTMGAATIEYQDLVKAGIIDPTMVTRSALQNAASIAKNILTTEAIVADAPEKAGAGAGMPGGMGGMDGMM